MMKEISVQLQMTGITKIPPRDSFTRVSIREPVFQRLLCYVFEDSLELKTKQKVFVEFPAPKGVFYIECKGTPDGYRIVFVFP